MLAQERRAGRGGVREVASAPISIDARRAGCVVSAAACAERLACSRREFCSVTAQRRPKLATTASSAAPKLPCVCTADGNVGRGRVRMGAALARGGGSARLVDELDHAREAVVGRAQRHHKHVLHLCTRGRRRGRRQWRQGGGTAAAGWRAGAGAARHLRRQRAVWHGGEVAVPVGRLRDERRVRLRHCARERLARLEDEPRGAVLQDLLQV